MSRNNVEEIENKMKVFIPIENKDGLDAMVDQRLGRAGYFLIYDMEKDLTVSVEENRFADAQHGVGIKVANHIVSSGCTAVLGAQAGPKAAEVLEQAGVLSVNIEGITAKQAIEGYRSALANPGGNAPA